MGDMIAVQDGYGFHLVEVGNWTKIDWEACEIEYSKEMNLGGYGKLLLFIASRMKLEVEKFETPEARWARCCELVQEYYQSIPNPKQQNAES